MCLTTHYPLDDSLILMTKTKKNLITIPNGITSSPHFETKRPNRLDKMARFKLFLKRKQLFITKLITKLQHFFHQQYKIQLYVIIQLPIQIIMTILLITPLSIMTITALSQCIPKQSILFLHQLFKLQSF